MYSRSLFLLAAVSGLASAVDSQPAATGSMVSEVPTQTASHGPNSPECARAQAALITGIPTPPPAFTGAIEASAFVQTDLSQICSFQSQVAPESLSAWTSYNNAVYSYYQAKSSDFVSVDSSCREPGETPSAQAFDSFLAVHSTFSASGCNGPSQTPTDGAAVPRQTGNVGAVAAVVVGLAGAVAVL